MQGEKSSYFRILLGTFWAWCRWLGYSRTLRREPRKVKRDGRRTGSCHLEEGGGKEHGRKVSKGSRVTWPTRVIFGVESGVGLWDVQLRKAEREKSGYFRAWALRIYPKYETAGPRYQGRQGRSLGQYSDAAKSPLTDMMFVSLHSFTCLDSIFFPPSLESS